jgi:hypothetical protein
MAMYGSSICGHGKWVTSDKLTPRETHLTGDCLQRNMADDEVLFDDVYELCEIIGK